jgi:glycosyltransferase involved in cell wall biosynthesis
MAKRTRIGLIFSYNENWIAGAYYILNIIHALKVVEEKEQPHIVVLSDSKENYNLVVSETNYPYLSFFEFPMKIPFTLPERIINKIGRFFLKKTLVSEKFVQPEIDFLYPKEVGSVKIRGLKKINWIPDFQEEFLPQFFSEKEVLSRKKYQKEIVCRGDFVVFSSRDAENHFITMYPKAKTNRFVLPFAVTHPNYSEQRIAILIEKYNLPARYFFAPNQFWAHKNHKVILQAVKHLKEEGQEVVVAFSGKENDYRNKEYVAELKIFITEHKLEENIKFLGFMARREQLCVMKHAVAIVQPSLFEGWSTVVEDAKATGTYIVLSNLEIHKEQVSEEVTFFDPNNPKELSQILKSIFLETFDVHRKTYDDDIFQFGNRFLELIKAGKR